MQVRTRHSHQIQINKQKKHRKFLRTDFIFHSAIYSPHIMLKIWFFPFLPVSIDSCSVHANNNRGLIRTARGYSCTSTSRWNIHTFLWKVRQQHWILKYGWKHWQPRIRNEVWFTKGTCARNMHPACRRLQLKIKFHAIKISNTYFLNRNFQKSIELRKLLGELQKHKIDVKKIIELFQSFFLFGTF